MLNYQLNYVALLLWFHSLLSLIMTCHFELQWAYQPPPLPHNVPVVDMGGGGGNWPWPPFWGLFSPFFFSSPQRSVMWQTVPLPHNVNIPIKIQGGKMCWSPPLSDFSSAGAASRRLHLQPPPKKILNPPLNVDFGPPFSQFLDPPLMFCTCVILLFIKFTNVIFHSFSSGVHTHSCKL